MQPIKHFLPLVYSALILCIFTISSIWLYQHIQSPDGNIRYFFGLPIIICVYLIQRHFFSLFLQKTAPDSIHFTSLLILKLTEFSFLFTLSAFTLNAYFLLIIIALLYLIGMLYSIYLYQKRTLNFVLITPHYDLILLCILSVVMVYIPQLHAYYTWLDINKIKWFSDALLLMNIMILTTTFIRTYLAQPTPSPH